MTVRLRWWMWLVGVAGVLAVGAGIQVWSTARFDTARWRQGEMRANVRRDMVQDLLIFHSPVGKSHSEIDSLLGAPTKTDKFPECDYIYWLGDDGSYLRIDSSWLCLKFRDGRVVEARRLTD